MDTEFYNLYVAKILEEVGELNKTKLLLQTQIAYQEKQLQDMTDLQNRLQQANNELNNRIKALSEKADKPEKKAKKAATEEPVPAEEGF
jgi:uncharacterized protein YlxW (UPF0749 family)